MTWEGLTNARDLGGLPTPVGPTCVGVLVRADHPGRLTSAGWASARAYGVARIVSLRTGGLSEADAAVANEPVVPPWPVEHVEVAIEDAGDPEFATLWFDTGLIGTPLYYRDALRRWPERHAAALAAIALSPGPTLVHCGAGFDRTGLITILLLHNAGVQPAAIVADYVESFTHRRAHVPGEVAARERLIAQAGTTADAVVADVVAHLDADFWSTGAVDPDLRATLRDRLVGT